MRSRTSGTVSRRSMRGSGVVQRRQEPSRSVSRMSGDGIIQFLMNKSPKNLVGEMLERGLSGKFITKLKNKIPPGDPSWAKQFTGEKHVPIRLPNGKFSIANYGGPGTKILKRLQRGDKPRTISDKVAQAHDIRYTLAKNVDDVRAADVKMVKKMKQIKKKKLDRPFNIVPGLRGIQAKIALEKTGVLPRDKFAPPKGVSYTPQQIRMLKSKLRTLEQQGFGPSEEMVKALAKIGITPRKVLPGQRLKEQIMKFEPEKLVANKLFPLLLKRMKKAGLLGSGIVLAGGRIKTKKGVRAPKLPFGVSRPEQITPKLILKILRMRRKRRRAGLKGGSATATIAASIASALLPVIISLGAKGVKALFKKIKSKKKKGGALRLAGQGIKEAFTKMIKTFIEKPAFAVAKKVVGGFVKLLLKGAKDIREEREQRQKKEAADFPIFVE